MVRLFGNLDNQEVQGSLIITKFSIPAFSRRIAKRRAMSNARAKGMEGAEITGVSVESSGDLPGQKIYEITLETPR